MVWEYISAYGTGSLYIWKGSINAERYFQVLQQHMLPSSRLFQRRSSIFQQDNVISYLTLPPVVVLMTVVPFKQLLSHKGNLTPVVFIQTNFILVNTSLLAQFT